MCDEECGQVCKDTGESIYMKLQLGKLVIERSDELLVVVKRAC